MQHAAQTLALHERNYSSKLDSAELVAGCGSFVIKSIKRSVINIQRSMLGVRCSTFACLQSVWGGFTVPARRNLIRGSRLCLSCLWLLEPKRIIGKPQLANNRDLHPPAATRIGSPLFSAAVSICALFITNYFHHCSNYSGEGISILWNYIFTI